MTDNIRGILDLINEMEEDQGDVELHDEFDIELSEDIIIESGVVDIFEDGILLEADDKALELLEEHGFILEETDWSKYDEPTLSRIEKGVTRLPTRQLNVPPAMRTAGMTGPEKRRQSLIKQGILKAQPDVEVNEAIDDNPVFNSIARRILLQNLDLFVKYGPKKVKNAIEEIALSVGPVDEIGTSDVSSWVKEVIDNLNLSLKETEQTNNRLEILKKIRHFFAKQLNDPNFQQAFNKASDRLDVERYLGTNQKTDSEKTLTSEKMVMGLPGDQGSKVMGEVTDISDQSPLEKAEMNLNKLRDQFNKLKTEYEKLEPHTWMYADFEQNLSDKERKARNMNDQLSSLYKQIKNAEAIYAKYNVTTELPDNIKKVVKFIADKIKNDPVNWDSANNTFSKEGLKNLENALEFKKNRIDYAKSLYNSNIEESKLPAAALMSLLSLAGIDNQALAYTDPTKSVEELARENPKVKELLARINALGQKPASDIAAEKMRRAQDQLKPSTAGPDEKIPTPSQSNVKEDLDEAKYQGREVPLGKPMAGDVKKSKVYVRKPNGKVVKVNFGDKKMRIKKSNPKRRKSFRARHNCKNPGPRWKARYWSCRAW